MRSLSALLASCAGLAAFAAATPPADAASAQPCIYDWAVPGLYEISGNFRGTVESAGARLTSDCRVQLKIPGVFAGGLLRKAGHCLAFSFKVEGVQQAFTARWCNTYGIVPWNGKQIRATIERRRK